MNRKENNATRTVLRTRPGGRENFLWNLRQQRVEGCETKKSKRTIGVLPKKHARGYSNKRRKARNTWNGG